ncbi:hypothetical protein CDD82_6547 [Ophiocordyceps australis]|uniref:Uncharacterized protein n=1 Tax=Ophiocordyceps australis TaxID=1399860 RepID=A0A2C5YWT5_9HYPO|nr:hypothetical protein CDD82_6547 [Ophiocordyceps australis]
MGMLGKGVFFLWVQLALGGCADSVSYSPLPTLSRIQESKAAAPGMTSLSISGELQPPALGNVKSSETLSETATTIYSHDSATATSDTEAASASDQLPSLVPGNVDLSSTSGQGQASSATRSSDAWDITTSSTTSSDPLAIETSSTTWSDALTIETSSTTWSDPLAISISIMTPSSRSTGAWPSSSMKPLSTPLYPCSENSTNGHADCRLAMDSECSRARMQLPTCIDGACLCMAAPCAQDSDCQDYNNCLVDEQAKCTHDSGLYPHMAGVCSCRPKYEGCMKEAEPQAYCEDRLNCTEAHRELYPQSALCVAQDDYETYAHGRCLCKSVACVFTGHQDKDEEACKGLVECREEHRSTAVCLGKYGERSFPDEGYCSCH